MANYNTVRRAGSATMGAEIDAGLRAHMNKVYGLMAVAMVITGMVAYAFGSSEALLSIFRDPLTLRPNVLGWVAMFAPLGMVFLMGSAVNKMSQAGAQLFFYVFAALMGLSISYIFAIYTDVSIAKTFLVTAISFAALSLYGYTTKKDISAWGSFLIMGVIGLIVAMIVNIFLQSAALDFAVSALGVLIFAGLTAYDTQKIKTMYLQVAQQGGMTEQLGKMAIFGALNLYMDFINLFMFLLHFMGSRE